MDFPLSQLGFSTQKASTWSQREWRDFCRAFNVRPDKNKGQHFLFQRSALRSVVAASELTGSDCVVEIGAGVGSLTAYLCEEAGQVEAVELDARLLPALQQIASYYNNLHPIHADALQVDIPELVGDQDYRVVGNIPYNITSHLIRKFLELPRQPERLVLTVQLEVARRILAEPGQMNLLALGVRAYGMPSMVGRIPAGAFYPPPKVESGIIVVAPFEEPAVPDEYRARLFLLARTAFNQKRKQLRNSLASDHALQLYGLERALEDAAIDPTCRPQDLAIEDWFRLARLVEPPSLT